MNALCRRTIKSLLAAEPQIRGGEETGDGAEFLRWNIQGD
jgi:hypothetical protein